MDAWVYVLIVLGLVLVGAFLYDLRRKAAVRGGDSATRDAAHGDGLYRGGLGAGGVSGGGDGDLGPF